MIGEDSDDNVLECGSSEDDKREDLSGSGTLEVVILNGRWRRGLTEWWIPMWDQCRVPRRVSSCGSLCASINQVIL